MIDTLITNVHVWL